MLDISTKNIQLNATATDKEQAIKLVAQGLTINGYVAADYATGMLKREQQISTYLDNGIAIPHGTLDTRHLVLQTGIQIYQFPEGVDWGEGHIAYVVIGIAAKSDEHLSLLQQLTNILSNENTTKYLASTQNTEQFIRLLTSKRTFPIIQESLIRLNIDSSNLFTLIATNAVMLNEQGYVEQDFVQDVVKISPLALNNNLYLTDSSIGNLANGIAIARNQQGVTVITVAMVDEQLQPELAKLIQASTQQYLSRANQKEILALFSTMSKNYSGNEITATFTLHNKHGLHTRPSTVFVNEAKKFAADIQVQNLDLNTPLVNGKSVINLMTLGAEKGARLHIVAKGEDAQEAMTRLGQLIEDGLGEAENEPQKL